MFLHNRYWRASPIANSWSFSSEPDMCDLMPAAQPAEKIGKMKKLRRTLSESFSRIGECQKHGKNTVKYAPLLFARARQFRRKVCFHFKRSFNKPNHEYKEKNETGTDWKCGCEVQMLSDQPDIEYRIELSRIFCALSSGSELERASYDLWVQIIKKNQKWDLIHISAFNRKPFRCVFKALLTDGDKVVYAS